MYTYKAVNYGMMGRPVEQIEFQAYTDLGAREFAERKLVGKHSKNSQGQNVRVIGLKKL